MHSFFEYSASVFITLKLIKAGTGGSKKNDISGHSRFAGSPNSVLESFRMFNFRSTLNLRFDLGGCGPDGVHALHSLPQQIVEYGIVAAFVLSA